MIELKAVTEPGQGFGFRCKQVWLDAAEVIDSLRVVPRVVLFAYGYWMIHLTDSIVQWYVKLPAVERTAQVTAFVTVVLPGVFGLSCWVFKVYSGGGRNWDAGATGEK